MNQVKEADLKRRMRTRFIEGMNFEDLMEDLVQFINTNYEVKQMKAEKKREFKLNRYAKELITDIEKYGGFAHWKQQFKNSNHGNIL